MEWVLCVCFDQKCCDSLHSVDVQVYQLCMDDDMLIFSRIPSESYM